MSRPLRRRELAPLAAGLLAGLCLPAWAQEKKDDGGGAGPEKKKEPSLTDLAMDWLARHQSKDGRWSSMSFSACCSGEVCDGEGEFVGDLRCSGLALQCFLACGETHQSGNFKAHVKEGIKYVRNVQDEDGAFGSRMAGRWWLRHATAAEASVETYGMTQSKVFDEMSRKAIAFTLAAMDPAQGLRSKILDVAPDAATVADLAVFVHAAKLATLLEDPRPAHDACLAWFAERTDEKTGTVRAEDPGAKPDPVDDDDRAACAGLVRILCPADVDAARKDDVVRRIADRLAAKPPVWSPAPRARMRFAAWQRRTMFLHQAGEDRHLDWNRRLEKLLASKQRQDGCAKGSFDPVDADADFRGRVEATALCALATTWPYRWRRRLAPPK